MIKNFKSHSDFEILFENEEIIEFKRLTKSNHYVISLQRMKESLETQFAKLHDTTHFEQNEFTIFDPTVKEIAFLEENQYKLRDHKFVMYLRPSSTSIQVKPLQSYTIKQIGIEECLTEDAINLAKLCFPQFYAEADNYTRFMKNWGGRDNQRHTGIFYGDMLVGLGTLTIETLGDIKFGNLGFGAIHPDHQKQGLYRHLINQRIEIALEEELTVVTTYGLIDTSGPILQKLGFTIAQTVATLVDK